MPLISRYVPVDLRGRRVVIIGGSIAGLATALGLAARGAEVLVLEADPDPGVDAPEEAFLGWSRRRVPQSRHSHVFLARLCNILRRQHPDLYAELLAHGAQELRLLDFPPPSLGPLEPEPGDEDLVTIGCRRTTFEWALRRYVRRSPNIDLVCGVVVNGLRARPGKPPRVHGVRVVAGGKSRSIAADLVVDASGRGSRVGDWLEGVGAPRPYERRSPSAVLYYTRFYRRRADRQFPPPGREPTMGDFGWIKFAVFPADNRAYSITFASHLSLPRLKVLSHPEAFDTMARALPGIAPFVDPEITDPLPVLGRDVLAMGGLENCLRRFVDRSGEPLAAGFFAIGDAAYHTNPLYGRGTSQAFMHADLLGESLDAAAGEPVAAARFLDQAAREEIEPFVRASVAADHVASRKVGAEPTRPLRRVLDSFFDHGVMPATRVDPVVYRAFVRMMNMMETPEQAFFKPEVAMRALAVWARGAGFRRRTEPTVPDRERTIAALEAAARCGVLRAARA
jgi:2-polyprenyl-6-methoxyphenol hydroxylase-like FAD-dependent oxidoreductase